ncbi:hypothetical protein MC7420_1895 [Coleofasciculus chthonoplastes PCC 7420]|uniref:Uncharacterized protein n=1 Tax=Coleofasciculus chthonoplastes PCC 7420 TaxID=118168 RepID=B4VMU0_9CYAN|nr:hypothetical protein MC7420_1895 [Coleofasciculus chthonoplastes PCC 7420]
MLIQEQVCYVFFCHGFQIINKLLESGKILKIMLGKYFLLSSFIE